MRLLSRDVRHQMRCWNIYDGALNADILIDFLRRVIKGVPKKVFLILDNLRVHHSKPLKAWLAKHPDEMVNADIKQAVTAKVRARV
jgi:hypothetical protein